MIRPAAVFGQYIIIKSISGHAYNVFFSLHDLLEQATRRAGSVAYFLFAVLLYSKLLKTVIIFVVQH